MAETVGQILLTAVGLEALAATTVIGSLTVASVVGGAVLVAGSIGLQLLTARHPAANGNLAQSALPPPEDGHVPLRQAIGPRRCAFGRVRLAGIYVLYEATVAGNSYDVVALHHGTIAAIVGYYLHDDVVTIDGSGIVQTQSDGRYGSSLIKIETRLGAVPETAYASMIAALPAAWTASHRGDGIASAALTCLSAAIATYTTIYPRGLPQLSVIADCTPVFDARDNTQSIGNSASWLVSHNPVVQAIEFLTNVDKGLGFDRSVLVDPVISALNAEANLCDATVALSSGGFEPRYASNGFFTLDSDPADVLGAILDTCDGWLAENGDGTLAFKVGVYRAPAFTIEAAHLKGFSLQYGIADEDLVNEIAFSYTEPQADYKTLPGDPWRDEADIAARGKTRSQPLALSWVQSHTQGRRLSKRKMAKLNAPLRGSIKTTLYGIQAWGERWITVDAPDVTADFAALVV